MESFCRFSKTWTSSHHNQKMITLIQIIACPLPDIQVVAYGELQPFSLVFINFHETISAEILESCITAIESVRARVAEKTMHFACITY